MSEVGSEIKSDRDPKDNISIPRRKFIKLLLAGGAAAVLAACGIGIENEKEIPEVNLQELISDPESYSSLSIFNVSGYPEQVDENTYSVPIFKPVRMGDNTFYITDYISRTVESYNLHITDQKESPSLEMFIEDSSYSTLAPRVPEGSNLSTEQHRITGKMTRIRDEDGKKKLVLEAQAVVNLEEIQK